MAALREKRGWKRPDLARAMGTSTQQVERLEKGQRKLNEGWLQRAGEALGVDASVFLSDADLPEVGRSPAPAPVNETTAPFRYEGASMERVRDDLPIYGTGLGAAKIVDGEAIEQTYLNTGEVVGYLKRPVLLNDRPDAYGLYLQGASMYPVYSEGAPIVAETKRPPRVGDDVVVYLRPSGEDDDGTRARAVLVKRLVRRGHKEVELEQFNPPINFRIPAEDILRIDRVMTLDDLLS